MHGAEAAVRSTRVPHQNRKVKGQAGASSGGEVPGSLRLEAWTDPFTVETGVESPRDDNKRWTSWDHFGAIRQRSTAWSGSSVVRYRPVTPGAGSSPSTPPLLRAQQWWLFLCKARVERTTAGVHSRLPTAEVDSPAKRGHFTFKDGTPQALVVFGDSHVEYAQAGFCGTVCGPRCIEHDNATRKGTLATGGRVVLVQAEAGGGRCSDQSMAEGHGHKR